MQISKEIISKDECFPIDDNGNSWTTSQEWIGNAIDEDHINGEYDDAEWSARCKVFASEARYMKKLIENGK